MAILASLGRLLGDFLGGLGRRLVDGFLGRLFSRLLGLVLGTRFALVLGRSVGRFGGLIGGFVGVTLWTLIRRVPLGIVANTMGPAVALGYAMVYPVAMIVKIFIAQVLGGL